MRTIRFSVMSAEITGLNDRIEKRGDDEVHMVDLCLRADLSMSVLDVLWIAGSADLWSRALWNDDGVPRAWGVKPIAADLKLSSQRVMLEVAGLSTDGGHLTVVDATLAGFKFDPRPDFRVALAWQVRMAATPTVWQWLYRAREAGSCSFDALEGVQGDLLDTPSMLGPSTAQWEAAKRDAEQTIPGGRSFPGALDGTGETIGTGYGFDDAGNPNPSPPLAHE